MIAALFSMLLNSLSTVFNKKALSYSTLTNLGYKSFAAMSGMVILCIFVGFLGVDVRYIFTSSILFVCILYVVIALYESFLYQNIYRKEKISDVLPFVNINKIITILVGFFIFGDSSWVTFFMSLLCGVIVIGFSLDLKKLTFPKKFSQFIYAEFITSLNALLTVYLLTLLDFKELFSMYYVLLGAILFSALIFKKEVRSILTQSKSFYTYRVVLLVVGQISFIITLFLIQGLGVITSVLLSFLGIAVTLMFSYFFFKDIPTKKSILQILLIAIFVGIGYVYK